MEYRKAKLDDLGSVFSITQAVIRDIYPYFYPESAIKWFAGQHDCERILADISAGRVRLLEVEDSPVGTLTIDGNRLLRIFVAPDQQHKGYGTRLLHFAEEEVAQAFDKAVLDSSLPSGRFFQDHGYRTRSHELYEVEDGHGMLLAILAWEVMEKPLREDAAVATPATVPANEEAAAEARTPAAVDQAPSSSASESAGDAPASSASAEPASSEGGATITISSGTADVMRQLPQMPF